MPTEMPEHEREATDASTEAAASASEVVSEELPVETQQAESEAETPVDDRDESFDEAADDAAAPESPEVAHEPAAVTDPEPEASDVAEAAPAAAEGEPTESAEAAPAAAEGQLPADAGEDEGADDDILAPAEPGARRAALADARSRRRMLVWPFVIYALLWAAFIALMVWQLVSLPDGAIAYNASVYAWTVWGGVALVALAPVTVLASWLLARRPGEDANEGVLSVALLRGSIVALVGVVIWWVALSAVDYVRLGRLF